MAVKIRLRREGKRKQPFYRVVVADVRSPRDGRFIDDLGYYQPLREPSAISIDADRALYWLRNGAQPSDAVRKLLRIEGVWEQFKPGDPGRDRSARHAAGAEARAERQEASAAPEGSRTPTSDDLPPVEVVGAGDATATTEADEPTRPPVEDAPADAGDAGAADQPTAAEDEETAS